MGCRIVFYSVLLHGQNHYLKPSSRSLIKKTHPLRTSDMHYRVSFQGLNYHSILATHFFIHSFEQDHANAWVWDVSVAFVRLNAIRNECFKSNQSSEFDRTSFESSSLNDWSSGESFFAFFCIISIFFAESLF